MGNEWIKGRNKLRKALITNDLRPPERGGKPFTINDLRKPKMKYDKKLVAIYGRILRELDNMEKKPKQENKMLKEEHRALTHPRLEAPKTTAKEISFLGL